MKASDKLLQTLRLKWEGCRLRSYRDQAGFPTIGIGHKLTQCEMSSGKILINGVKVRYADGITLEQALDLCRQDLKSAEYTVNAGVKVPLEQRQFDALCSFVFNVGCNAFTQSTLLKRLNLSHYDDVPEQMKRWIYAGGERCDGLIQRRREEIKYWDGEI